MADPLPPGRVHLQTCKGMKNTRLSTKNYAFTSFLTKRPLAAFMITSVIVGGLTSYYDPLWNKKMNDPFWNTYKSAPP